VVPFQPRYLPIRAGWSHFTPVSAPPMTIPCPVAPSAHTSGARTALTPGSTACGASALRAAASISSSVSSTGWRLGSSGLPSIRATSDRAASASATASGPVTSTALTM
jgi:hypothetical protein